MFKGYINPAENKAANKILPKLMVEGMLLGGSGLGILALIFEIAADAFSVAAYQTLLAIHGAEGHHEIAMYAFFILSALLLLGIVPAYKAGAYLRPNAGGSGPLVEAIGPPKMRWLSWIGSSLFFIDAILTIIISSISAADAVMLLYPELSAYRIALAEIFAFFIMAVLVALGPKRAVPLFLIGGGAFTLFSLMALSVVGGAAWLNPEWAFLTEGIVSRLETTHVVEHVVRAQEQYSSLGGALVLKLLLSSMASAMLGFSGYEVIPASGKHAARPKWKVINTALTLAAFFLIGTGIIQLYAASQWNIPSTEGYSTLLIEYEIVGAQLLGEGVEESDIVVTQADEEAATAFLAEKTSHGDDDHAADDHAVDELAHALATERALTNALSGTTGQTFLFVAGVLLAIILLLAQGGGYIGGAAVAANAARLGRLPAAFDDDRFGIAVIWGIAAILIPIIQDVLTVEAYYAFGFVSAFVITSTTVFFVRDQALIDRGIEPGSSEAKSLKFAGLRGMIASYFMAYILVTQKTDALLAIVIAGAIITAIQLYVANGKLKNDATVDVPVFDPGTKDLAYNFGFERALDESRQRGTADAITDIIASGAINKFNVSPKRIEELAMHLYNLPEDLFAHGDHDHHDHVEEPSEPLEEVYQTAHNERAKYLRDIEDFSHFGIFMFIHNYHPNWVDEEHHRSEETVIRAMLDILFPLTDTEEIWEEYQAFEPRRLPEAIWQFSRLRYEWAKDQWPNLSDRITTIWTLQDFGLIPHDVDIETKVAIMGGRKFAKVTIPTLEDDEHQRATEVEESPEDDVEDENGDADAH